MRTTTLRRPASRGVTATLLAVLGISALAAHADDPAPAPSTNPSESRDGKATPNVRQLIERLEKVEAELARLKQSGRQVPADKQQQRLVAVLESPYLGPASYGPQGNRFFATRLIFVNLTPQPIVLHPRKIVLEVDGRSHERAELANNLRYRSFQVGRQSFALRNLNTAERLDLPSGASASTWVVYGDLPQGDRVPKLVLRIPRDANPLLVDVNRTSMDLLGMDVERIGPRKSLGLITISGMMNSINVGGLVEALDRLVQQKVARVVIRWTANAAPIDPRVLNWLRHSALSTAHPTGTTNDGLPKIPAALRELHLAELPGDRAESSTASASGPPGSEPQTAQPNAEETPGAFGPEADTVRLHRTASEAVTAALHSAFEVLPRDELLDEIRSGPPLTRAAAIAGGGGRLDEAHLPLLLKYADDDDPNIQRAALVALSHFGDPRAIETLVRHARRNNPSTTHVAVEGLAHSRYAAAHEALLSILKGEPPDSRREIVEILGRYPRKIWSETIYEYAHDADPQVAAAALVALMRIGHPQLLKVFEESLERGDRTLRAAAFALLASRTDPASEELAMSYTLRALDEAPPTQPMLDLIRRTRDGRAIPLLLKHLDSSEPNRAAVIGTLAQIGDETVAQVFREKYPSFESHEKAMVLRTLHQLRSPAFRKLAKKALQGSDSSLIAAACEGLRQEGSAEAVELLAEALETSDNASVWTYTANALSMLRTPRARQALRKACESDHANKRNYALGALRNMQQRSPGYQYVYQAQQFARQEKWQEAQTRYDVALKLDPDLPDAYAGRAHVLTQQKKFKQARDDYRKALELDPDNSQAVTGMAIVMVLDGDWKAGVRFAEDGRKKFPNDMLYAYNSACVFARVVERLQKEQDIPDRDAKLAEYRNKALADLRRAVKLGFGDRNWMKKDPDLQSLHGLPEFKKIHSPE